MTVAVGVQINIGSQLIAGAGGHRRHRFAAHTGEGVREGGGVTGVVAGGPVAAFIRFGNDTVPVQVPAHCVELLVIADVYETIVVVVKVPDVYDGHVVVGEVLFCFVAGGIGDDNTPAAGVVRRHAVS